jgi:hypothetical protein
VTTSYYDWDLALKKNPQNKKNRKINELGISAEDFKRFIKLWKSKNIVF